MKVTLIAALTADGFIAQNKDHISTAWTSKEDAAFFRATTKELGVMIMGRTTYETIGRPLPGRTTVVLSRSAPQELLQDQNYDTLYSSSLEPALLVEALEKRGHQTVAICGGSSVYRLFMESGLVSRLLLTIEPVLFGDGIPLFDQAFTKEVQMTLTERHILSDQTTVMEYHIPAANHLAPNHK